jgi:hypothetical protein
MKCALPASLSLKVSSAIERIASDYFRSVVPAAHFRNTDFVKWRGGRAEGHVDQGVVNYGWDSIFIGIPLIALLAFSFFRLDEAFTARKKSSPENRPRSATVVRKGQPLGTDPDGRSWDEDLPSPKK